ncbi:MAG: DUF4381 family protein [SAR324 cluster bacterium]|nr:DUF4381 family protein [SAR324 cluster bacterium]
MRRPSHIAVFLFIFCWLAAIQGTQAFQNLEVKAQIDKATATTGNFLLYQIEVTYPALFQLVPVDLKQYLDTEQIDIELLDPLLAAGPEITEDSSWLAKWWPFHKEQAPSSNTIRWSWRLWPVRQGTWTIPEIPIQSLQKKQNEPELQGRTNPVTFTVHDLFASDTQNPPALRIENQLPPPPSTMLWLWVVIPVIAAVILGIAYVLYKRRASDESLTPRELPHEQALRRLRELEQFFSVNPQEVHQYYYQLSEIFREYLENAFSFSATSMTTQEFLPLLKTQTPYSVEEHQKITLLTQRSDLIKYAEVLPTRAEMDEAYREVVGLVEKAAYSSDEDVAGSASEPEKEVS